MFEQNALLNFVKDESLTPRNCLDMFQEINEKKDGIRYDLSPITGVVEFLKDLHAKIEAATKWKEELYKFNVCDSY